MNEIILIGGGGNCNAAIDVIEQEGKFKIAGIVDKKKNWSNSYFKYDLIGDDSDLISLAMKYKYALVTIGQIKESSSRVRLFNLAIEAGFILPSIISPKAYVSKYASIGDGNIIMHNALINTNVKIGHNCIINTNALIEHDSSIGDHCHISTGAIINGNVSIGKRSFIGSGSITKHGISVDAGSFVKAGTVLR